MRTEWTLAEFSRFTTGLAIALCLFAPAVAQTTALAIDPTAFDVAGVRLGMTPDEATAGLKSFDPAMVVKKRYLSGPGASYGSEGKELTEISEQDRKISYLDNLYAIKGAAKTECDKIVDPRTLPRCYSTHPDDEETVKVWFSRTPGQERVIGVQRAKTFYKEPKPAIPTLKEGVFTKYPKDQLTYESQSGWTNAMGWQFDSKRRIISGPAAKAKRMEMTVGLPRSVKSGDGIELNVVFTGNNRNNQIAESLLVTLTDDDALYKLRDQSKAASDSLKARANAQELEKSAQSPSQTKF